MRILCAVDGSEYSQWGVQALEALAGREPEHVTILHVVDPSALRTARGGNPVAEKRALAAMEKAGGILLREAERSARVALAQAATSPRTKFNTTLAHGPLAQTIVRQARRVKADLILIGSRGLSDIRGFLLGSISRQVASIARCSIFVVNSRSRSWRGWSSRSMTRSTPEPPLDFYDPAFFRNQPQSLSSRRPRDR